MSSYNGHKNWNHWNVSLWLNNDEGLYRLVRSYRRCPDGPQQVLNELHAMGMFKTPDGATYNVTSIKAAMRDM